MIELSYWRRNMKKAIVFIVLYITSCGGKLENFVPPTITQPNQQVTFVNVTRQATDEECANGGSVVELYQDTNGDGIATDADKYQSALVSCNGSNGVNGVNSQLLVSSTRSATAEECAYGGMAMEIYLDLDDSRNYSAGDLLQDSVFACNGAPGSNATVTVALTPSTGYLTTTCVPVGGTSLYAKKSSSNAVLYNNPTCSGQSVVSLNSGSNEMYWPSLRVSVSAEGSGSSISLRTIVYGP